MNTKLAKMIRQTFNNHPSVSEVSEFLKKKNLREARPGSCIEPTGTINERMQTVLTKDGWFIGHIYMDEEMRLQFQPSPARSLGLPGL